MTTHTDDRERLRRIEAEWTRNPNATPDEVERVVDARFAAEATQRAQDAAKVDESVASFQAMALTCGACGALARSSPHDVFCDQCRKVNYAIEAAQAADELVDGTTRLELVQAYRQRKEANS
jgi:hypothetical protein